MNENLDLCKILAGCPKGTPLYSTIRGDVKFVAIDTESVYPIRTTYNNTKSVPDDAYFTSDGRYFEENNDAECVLFPSRDCRDWSQFKLPQTDFKKGDHILWRNNDGNEFFGVFFRYTDDGQGVVRILRGETTSDWDVYIKDLTKLEKFDPKLLKTGDAVLVRDRNGMCEWMYSPFSHISFEEGKPYYIASCSSWELCVPYNQETEGLIGTCDKAPKFYDLTEKQD